MANINDKRPLPAGWRWARLGNVCEIIAGQSPPGDTYRSVPDGLPFFQGKADFGLRHPVARYWCVAPKKFALPGDILISVRAPVGPTNVADVECCIGRGLAAIRPRTEADRDFILAALKLYEDRLEKLGSGSTFGAIKRDDLESLEIPLPPPEEQKRIAAILNEQMAAVERARAAAEAQFEAAKALPAAYLRAVFSSPEAQQWPRRRLGEFIASTRNGFGRRPKGIEDGPIVLRLADVTNGCIDLSHPRHVAMSPEEIAAYRLQKGDVLFLRVNGSSELVGRCVLVDVDRHDVVFNDHLIRVRLLDELDAQYLKAVSAYPEVRSQIVEMASTSAGQLTVNQEALGSLAIPAPSLADQRRVTGTLNEQMVSAGRTRKAIEEQLDGINKLPAALLRRAFSGEL